MRLRNQTSYGRGHRNTRAFPIQDQEDDQLDHDTHSPAGCAHTQEGNEHVPIVQFASPMAFGHEGENAYINVEVIRIGDCSQVTKVAYETGDVTAKAGVIYEGARGEVIFQPGEERKDISVKLINNSQWNTTTEFKLELLADGLVNANLGRFLWLTRVKVIDDDYFPSNYYRLPLESSELIEKGLQEVSRYRLLWEYFRMNLGEPVIFRRTMAHCVVGMMLNLLFALRVIANVYLVDFVLNKTLRPAYMEEYTEVCLIGFTCLTVFEIAFKHILDYLLNARCSVGGRCKTFLQTCLLRKFLNYDDDARENFPQSDLVMAMVRDITAMVDGYGEAIKIVDALGMCFVIFVLQLLKPLIHSQQPSLLSSFGTMFFPLLLVPIFLIRDRTTQQTLQNAAAKQNNLIDYIEYTVDVFRLVADYSKRSAFVSLFEVRIQEFNTAARNSRLALLTNAYFAPWIVALATAGYMALGGIAVIHDQVTLGEFLANLSILAKIGEAWSDIYRHVLNLQGVFPSLDRVVIFMNMRTDIKQRMELARDTQAFMTEARKRMKSTGSDRLHVDMLPIKFQCGGKPDMVDLQRHARWEGTVEFSQGKLIAFVGPRGGGKSTVLRMLGGAKLPWLKSNVRCFVPPHLRVLHVSHEPLLIQGTLLQNLTFGVVSGDPDGDLERVKKICKRLHMDQTIVNMLEETRVWHGRLSQSEQRQINIARALIANYHLICIHRPTMGFSDRASETIMSLLSEFVRNKGVEQDPATVDLRRPRTCLMTNSKLVNMQFIDEVYMVKANQIRKTNRQISLSELE